MKVKIISPVVNFPKFLDIQIEKFKEICMDTSAKNKENSLMKITSSFEEFIHSESKIPLANLETLKYKDIEELSKRFKTLGLKINGILLLKNN